MKTAVERVKTRTAEIWKDQRGILWIVPMEGVLIDREDILDNFLVVRHLSAAKPVLKIIDSRGNWKLTPEAQDLFRKEDSPDKTIARAVLTKSRTERFIKSFLSRLYKPEVPLAFFTSEEEAAQWLLSQK